MTHDVSERDGIGFAKVVVYSDAELRRLAAAGFPPRVVVGDLAALDRSQRHAESAVRARSAAQRALPSNRASYRQMAEYQADLKGLVEQNPGLVRKVTLPLQSLEGRPIEGVEIADEVERPTTAGRWTSQWASTTPASGRPAEIPMEFAIDLVKRFNAGDARVRSLLGRVRVVVLPMVNPDGFAVSRGAGEPTPADDDSDLTLSLALSDARLQAQELPANSPAAQGTPCASTDQPGRRPQPQLRRVLRRRRQRRRRPAAQNYRGPAPYSEPSPRRSTASALPRHITR